MIKSRQIQTYQLFIHIMFIAIMAAIIIPFFLVVSISFTEEQTLLQRGGYQLLPKVFSIEAYNYLLSAPKILLKAYGVTILVTACGTLGSVILTPLTGYVLSRRDFRYNRILVIYIFITMMFSGGLVPAYMLMTRVLHLQDTLFALFLPGMMNAFLAMVMKGFIISTVPYEIIESVKMDGARELTIYMKIVFPLVIPAVATIALLVSFGYWNDYFASLLYISNNNLIPLQLLLYRMLASVEFLKSNPEYYLLDPNLASFPSLSARMGMVILAAGPMMFVFPFFQKYFISGLTVGSLKG